jgi:periplasmic divalent cation tolerance protein
MPDEYCLVLCTCPDRPSADCLAEALVRQRLAACVNLLPGIASVYRWEGQVERAEEQLLLIKTERRSYPALQEYIQRHHPYQVPEIIALPIVAGSSDYLQWVSACLRSES